MKKILFLSFVLFLPEKIFSDMLPPGYTSKSIAATDRYLFIGTDYGVNIYDKKKNAWGVFYSSDFEKSVILEGRAEHLVLNKDICLSVAIDDNTVWFGFYGKGVKKLDLKTGKWETFEGYRMVWNDKKHRWKKVGNCPLISNYVYSILINKKHNIWFATESGISKFDGKNWKNYAGGYFRDGGEKPIKVPFIKGVVTSIICDKRGRIWIGCSDFHFAYYDAYTPEEIVEGGLTVLDKENWKHYYAKNYNLEHPDEHYVKTELISNDVRCLAIDGNELWIGTGKGISVFNIKTGEWKNYAAEDGLPSNTINSISIGKDEIWVGTGKGIAKYEKRSKRWTSYTDNVLPVTSIRSLYYDKYDNCLWAITPAIAYKDIYLYKFDGKKWTIFPTKKRLVFKNDNELLEYGKFLRRRKIIKEAESIFTYLAKKHPENAKIQYEALITGKKDINVFIEFKKKFPNTPYALQVQFEIAKYYESKGNYKQAIKEYKKFIKKSTDKEQIFKAKMRMADCYRALKDYKKQIKVLEDLYQNFPEKRKGWNFTLKIAGIYMNKLKDYESAISAFERFLKNYWEKDGSGSSGEVILKIGKCYELLGEYKKAIETYRRIKPETWKFKEAKKRIIELENKLGIEKGYPFNIVEIDRFNKNYIWLGSEGGGVFRYDKFNKVWKNFNVKNGLLSSIIKKIVVSRKYVWVITEKGLTQIDKEMNLIKNYTYKGDVVFDGKNIWIADEKGIIKYDESQEKWKKFDLKEIKLNNCYGNLRFIVDKNYIWVYRGRESNGHISGYNEKIEKWDKFGEIKYGISFAVNGKDYIWCKTEDVLGGSGGTYGFNKKTGEWKKFLRIHYPKILLTKDYVWFVLLNNKIYRYNKKKDKLEPYTSEDAIILRKIFSKGIFYIDDQLWAFFPKGVVKYDDKKERWEKFYAPSDFTIYNIRILDADNVNVWYTSEQGLFKFNTVNKEWKSISLKNVSNLKIGKDYIWIISDGKLYRCKSNGQELEMVVKKK